MSSNAEEPIVVSESDTTPPRRAPERSGTRDDPVVVDQDSPHDTPPPITAPIYSHRDVPNTPAEPVPMIPLRNISQTNNILRVTVSQPVRSNDPLLRNRRVYWRITEQDVVDVGNGALGRFLVFAYCAALDGEENVGRAPVSIWPVGRAFVLYTFDIPVRGAVRQEDGRWLFEFRKMDRAKQRNARLNQIAKERRQREKERKEKEKEARELIRAREKKRVEQMKSAQKKEAKRKKREKALLKANPQVLWDSKRFRNPYSKEFKEKKKAALRHLDEATGKGAQ